MSERATIADSVEPGAARRLRLSVRGAVQGVGFRPFVYRLAIRMNLTGWIRNTDFGAILEVEGDSAAIGEFQRRLALDAPSPALVSQIEATAIQPAGSPRFEIRASDAPGLRTAVVLPDLATCSRCRDECFDPANRRYRYPFTNCTRCGPRFSIIESLPYDRSNTSMRRFKMCLACQSEYDDPADRRFHAQPNACPRCGPQLAFWDNHGTALASRDDALHAAAAAIRAGRIVAIKGIGGFQLVVDARSDDAVSRLRRRKNRAEKPFAVMMPSLDASGEYCDRSEQPDAILLSPAAPIVLLRRREGASLAASLAPENPYIGVMLPYSPLHHLLLRDLSFPLVATSGNCADEPICLDEQEALDRLAGIADCFLVHDRPILNRVDDSVARIIFGRELILRRARGYAPLPITVPETGGPVLAVGGHLKNTVALAVDGTIFVSQHIGDLDSPRAIDAFEAAAGALPRLHVAEPAIVACDLHPDYLSTQFARQLAARPIGVQHHHAHVVACMAENDLDSEVLGICWDGAGFGPDGTIWGGEFLGATRQSYRRLAHLRTFLLPGGERAVREPRRSALGLLFEMYGERVIELRDLPPVRALSSIECAALARMMDRLINSPRTSSMGRLFDGVASLLDVRQRSTFEGQAAMELEFAAERVASAETYPFDVCADKDSPMILDWAPTIRAILAGIREARPRDQIAARFHRTLVEMIVAVAQRAGLERVVLSGGCFQNKLVLEAAVTALRHAGFQPFWHRTVPPNDGCIALGQAVIALHAARCSKVK